MNKPKPWTDLDRQDLRTLYPHFSNVEIAEELGRTESAISNAAIKMGLRKSDDYMASHPGGFPKGGTPWNKGRNHKAGGRSVETRFKPGQIPPNWRPIGHERVTKEGILQRKVTDTGNTPRDYRAVHALIWEEHNGPIPPGHLVRFRDGNRRNFDPDNLELVSRAENMRLNSVHRLPKELADTIQLMGALNRQINKRAAS